MTDSPPATILRLGAAHLGRAGAVVEVLLVVAAARHLCEPRAREARPVAGVSRPKRGEVVLLSENGVRLVQNTQVGPCIPVGIHLQKG